MQKTEKIVLLLCFCLHSFSIFAQHDEYIAAENIRIANTKQTEKEIEKFVNDNFKNYKLAREVNDEVIKHLREEEEFSQEELEARI